VGAPETVDYKRVARVYRDAVARQIPPTRAVALDAGITQMTAAQRVKRARDRGLIPPPTTMVLSPRCPTCGASRYAWRTKPNGRRA
jgi:hypothetical protein